MQHIDSSASNGVPPVELANQLPVKLKTITVVGPEEVEEGARWGNDECNYFLKNKKEVKVNMVLLGLRVTAFVFCIISFAVLAADKEGIQIMQQYSLPNSFNRFNEFKYTLSVNAIGFVYSGLQIFGLVKYFITKKYTLNPLLRGYFNFAMDQIVTYLLMSASSSAATLAYNWESIWGEYKFAIMANASVTFSYIAFVAFALTSLVSGYIICKIKLVNPTLSVYSNTIPYASTSTQAVCNK
ncbi:hypothetical protein TanjilG_04063 [Lupinus angustifolius]|uniref:CASP-like protein n=1 Tax=Lupinus angustifolius TaxID=3871 RepID=A0A4P1RAZ9_LUPAN|nr:PREDICTED: CASP-like protein N24 [Lupinus angustifolius]OIW06669.1 hypothetical protein TanjilG_04063 [Lupinus angustifolius]